jgi:hypothetical protein
MALEFEKILHSLDEMAQATAGRRHSRQELIAEVIQTLNRYAQQWPAIAAALQQADELSDPKYYRSARPLDEVHPLNAALDAPALPAQATIIATDGSQILPDRHAAHLYYLINIGGIVYHHQIIDQQLAFSQSTGESPAPETFSIPQLVYPASDWEAAEFAISSGAVNIARDLKEIGALADKAWQNRDSAKPLLAILDQRLLYWPIGGADNALNQAVRDWLVAMTKLHDSGAFLAGFIDRPMTGAVITLLLALTGMGNQNFDWKSLGKPAASGGLIDEALFSQLLQPGQRSKIFVNVSPRNTQFADYDPANEVCFFYFNPGITGHHIARVDIPMWVAVQPVAVGAVHALLYDQCQLLGDYPYVIARADEIAVVGHQDHEELNFMIDLHMQRYGVESRLTAKQSSKGLARGGKTRHGI